MQTKVQVRRSDLVKVLKIHNASEAMTALMKQFFLFVSVVILSLRWVRATFKAGYKPSPHNLSLVTLIKCDSFDDILADFMQILSDCVKRRLMFLELIYLYIYGSVSHADCNIPNALIDFNLRYFDELDVSRNATYVCINSRML